MEEGTGARLLVEAQGLRPDVLAARGFPGSGQNPEYRLRRTRGRLADALYMPVVDQAALSSGDGTRWTAEVVEPLQELPPFVRAVRAAEARYPAEQAVADGATPVTDPLAITGLGPQPSFLEGEWSAASLVASTVVIPDAEPPPVAGATARRRIIHGEDVVILRVPAPLSDPRAMGPWKVAVCRRLDGQAPELLTPEEVQHEPLPPRRFGRPPADRVRRRLR